MLVHELYRARFPLEAFQNSTQVANAFNNMLGIDIISGDELKAAHKKQCAGKSPPRQGPRTRIPHEEFLDLCQLVFSCTSIEQANCSAIRLDRSDLTAAIGEIINTKLAGSDEDVLNSVKFYGRIQAELARGCVLTTNDKRELLRATWLIYDNQKTHYEHWERELVELGFGR